MEEIAREEKQDFDNIKQEYTNKISEQAGELKAYKLMNHNK